MKKIISFLIVLFFLVSYIQNNHPRVLGDSTTSVGVMIYAYAVNITDIGVSNYLPTIASVSWETSASSACVFSFGETDSYEIGSFSETVASADHLAELSSLTPDTLYYYKIECLSSDGDGYGERGSLSFETPISEQIIDIEGVAAESDEESAEISWNTSELSTCSIYLGRTSLFEIGTFDEGSYSVVHTSILNDLSDDTRYYYKISCEADGGSKYGETGTLEFTTEESSSDDEEDEKKKDKKEATEDLGYTSFDIASPSVPGIPSAEEPKVIFPENKTSSVEEKQSATKESSAENIIKDKLGIADYLRTDIVLVIIAFFIILISDLFKLGKLWDRSLFILAYSVILVAVIATIGLIFSSGGTLILNTISLITELCLFIYGIKVISENDKRREKVGDL